MTNSVAKGNKAFLAAAFVVNPILDSLDDEARQYLKVAKSQAEEARDNALIEATGFSLKHPYAQQYEKRSKEYYKAAKQISDKTLHQRAAAKEWSDMSAPLPPPLSKKHSPSRSSSRSSSPTEPLPPYTPPSAEGWVLVDHAPRLDPPRPSSPESMVSDRSTLSDASSEAPSYYSHASARSSHSSSRLARSKSSHSHAPPPPPAVPAYSHHHVGPTIAAAPPASPFWDPAAISPTPAGTAYVHTSPGVAGYIVSLPPQAYSPYACYHAVLLPSPMASPPMLPGSPIHY